MNMYDEYNGILENKTIHIYNTGNHTKVDERFPVVLEAINPMYFRTLSKTNDSVGSPHHKHLPKVCGNNIFSVFKFMNAEDVIDVSISPIENITDLEISKTCSPAAILIKHLNERIRLRERQLDGFKKLQ